MQGEPKGERSSTERQMKRHREIKALILCRTKSTKILIIGASGRFEGCPGLRGTPETVLDHVFYTRSLHQRGTADESQNLGLPWGRLLRF